MWFNMGMPEGTDRFLTLEEPVWAVQLLKICYPSARWEDLENAAALFFGIASSSINKQRTLRRRGQNSPWWVTASEPEIKSQLGKVERKILKPWDCQEIEWMKDARSLHVNAGGGAVTDLKFGPVRVTRWFIDEGAFLGNDVQTGRMKRAWSIKISDHGEESRGYMCIAHGSGPDLLGGNRSILFIDSTGWASPWPGNPPGNPADV